MCWRQGTAALPGKATPTSLTKKRRKGLALRLRLEKEMHVPIHPTKPRSGLLKKEDREKSLK